MCILVRIPSNELDLNLNNLVCIILGIFLNKLARNVACVLPGYKIAVSHYRCTTVGIRQFPKRKPSVEGYESCVENNKEIKCC